MGNRLGIVQCFGCGFLAALIAACSVSTPRDGFTAGGAAQARRGATGAADPSAGQGGGTGSDGTPIAAASASADSSGGQGAVSGPELRGPATGRGPLSSSHPAGAVSQAHSTGGASTGSLTISVLAGYTGAYGGLMKLIADNGFGLWVDEANATGGVDGRRLVVKEVDNHDTAEGGVAACKEVQGNGSFMAISLAGLGGADVSSTDCLDQAGIPMFGLNLSGYRSTWKDVVSMNDDAKQAAPLASFIKDVIGDGSGKVGMIVVNDPIHLAARAQVNADLARLHITHVHDEIVAAGQGSFVAELSRLRSAGATTVAIITGNEAIGIVRDAKAIGYSPHLTGVLWTLDEFSQAAGDLWAGIKAIRVWPTTDSPAYQAYAAKAQKYGHTTLVNTTVMATYGSGLVLSEILRRVGPNLARAAVAPAAEGVVNYDNGIVGLSFGPGKRVSDIKAFPLICCNPDNTWRGIGQSAVEF